MILGPLCVFCLVSFLWVESLKRVPTVITCRVLGYLGFTKLLLEPALWSLPAASSINSQVPVMPTPSETLGRLILAKTLLLLFPFSCFLIVIHWIPNSWGNNEYVHEILNKWIGGFCWQQWNMKGGRERVAWGSFWEGFDCQQFELF